MKRSGPWVVVVVYTPLGGAAEVVNVHIPARDTQASARNLAQQRRNLRKINGAENDFPGKFQCFVRQATTPEDRS